jgi:hypothetical protein
MKRYFVVSPLCLLAVACGGGGEVTKTSQDCFNEGYFSSGSKISVVVNNSDDSGGFYQVEEVYSVINSYVEGGEVHASVSEPLFVQAEFSFGNGLLKEYGYSGGKPPFVISKEITPPKAFPITMDVGQIYRQSYSVIIKSNGPSGPSKDVWDAEESRTYVGREAIKTRLGDFESCRFKTIEKMNASSGAATSYSLEKSVWIAAAGSYRGLVLRTETVRSTSSGARSTASREVAKVNIFNVN